MLTPFEAPVLAAAPGVVLLVGSPDEASRETSPPPPNNSVSTELALANPLSTLVRATAAAAIALLSFRRAATSAGQVPSVV